MKKTIFRSIVILCIMATVLSVPVYAKSKKKKVKYKLNKTSITIDRGETFKLVLKSSKGKKVNPKKIKWSSSNKQSVYVNKKGKVEALKFGKSTIKAKYKGKTYKCKVKVEHDQSCKICEDHIHPEARIGSPDYKETRTLKDVSDKNGNLLITKNTKAVSSMQTGKQSKVYDVANPSNIFVNFMLGCYNFVISDTPYVGDYFPEPLYHLNNTWYYVFRKSDTNSDDHIRLASDTTYYSNGLQVACVSDLPQTTKYTNFTVDIFYDFKDHATYSCDKYPFYRKAQSHQEGEKYVSYESQLRATNLSPGETFTLTVNYRGIVLSIPCICLE